MRIKSHKNDDIGTLMRLFPEDMKHFVLEDNILKIDHDKRENYWIEKIKIYASHKLKLGDFDF